MEINLIEFLERQAGSNPHRVKLVNDKGEELQFKEVGDTVTDINGNQLIITKTVNGVPVNLEPIHKKEGN